MSEGASDREALLEARVKELEAAAAQVRRAGPFEQGWALLRAFVPPWLLALGAAVFVTFHAWVYFNQAQMLEAETELKKAVAAEQDAERRAQTAKTADGDEARLATVQAEVTKAQAEAASTKADADAKNKEIDGVTLRLATLKAELAKKEAEVSSAQAAAEAAAQRSGLDTLQGRLQKALLLKSALEGTMTNLRNAFSDNETPAEVEQAACGNRAVAVLLKCPKRYY